MSATCWRFAVLYFLGCSVMMAIAVVMPGSQGPVAVFAKPWGRSAVEVIARADGNLMISNPSPWVAVTDIGGDDYVSRLYGAGAGFVASAAVAYVCARLSGTELEY